ncbi:uncharacterized protein LOC143896558 [Temnothorax americanus]|uniref:uncharacterized protein LOC143896558 n=1 Tax=Temnothorax americanus TaxID=1964332 RepID=UPI00406807E8
MDTVNILYYIIHVFLDARKACCILIDTVANGLKFILNTNGTEHEKIKTRDENDQNKELRIQELYRKVYEEDAKDYGQKYSNKTNFDNSNNKSIRKHKSKKHRTKHCDGKRHRHNRHRNEANDVLPESDAVIVSTINNPQQITIIHEKCEKENVIIPQNTSPEMRIIPYTMSADKLKNNTDLRKFKTTSQKQENVSDDIDTDTEKLQNKQNFDYMKHFRNFSEEVTIASQHQLNKDCTTRTMNKPVDPHYDKLFTKRELHDEFRKGSRRFPQDIKSFTHECYENSSITKDRIKPVLLRVVNWLFGGCPEASRRHREQNDEVGKEEIFKSTNMWLPESSELYLQQ